MAPKKKPAAKKKRKPSGARRWTTDIAEQIRVMFVQGVEAENGRRVHPSLKTLGADFNVSERTLYKHSSDERWLAQREEFTEQLRQDADQKRIKVMVDQSVTFDSTSLALARGVQAQISRFITNAEARRKEAAAPIIETDKKGVVTTRPGDPNFNPISPTQLTMLSNALSASQKVGRLALGLHTEKLNVTDTSEADAALQNAIADLFELHDHTGEGNP